MSRILVVGINYAPEKIGTGKYTNEMCEWLAMRGHTVRVITAPPYYPAWKIWKDYGRWWFGKQAINGVEVIRCPLWVPLKPRGLTRLLHLGSFALTSSFAMLWSLFWRPQRVVAVAPTLANAPAIWLLARASRAKCWLHIQDFELDAMLEMGIVDAGAFRRAAEKLERWLLRRFDYVSTISPKMIERLAAKGVDENKRLLFPNWVDIDAVRPLDAPSPYRTELGIPENAIVALYSGNMGLKQGLEFLGEAALQLKSESLLYFVFGGEGPARSTLETTCRGLSNVRFLNLQPTERLNDWLGLADIHLLPQRADVADLVMPSKLTGMLASGRPVLATSLPGTSLAIAVKECGQATTPGDLDAFSDVLLTMSRDADLRRHLGKRAREQAEASLGREGILQRFEQELIG